MSDRIDYERVIQIDGDVDKALEVSLNSFVNAGFRILSRDANGHELEAQGPLNSRQNPLVMVSRVRVERDPDGSEIRIRAIFGGVRRLQRFMVLLIGGLALLFLVLFGFMFKAAVWFVILPLAPWVVLIPWMSRLFARRVTRSLDILADNMQSLAR